MAALTSTSLTLAGVKIGEDTTEDGRVIIRITGASNPYTVTVFNATGGGAVHRGAAPIGPGAGRPGWW